MSQPPTWLCCARCMWWASLGCTSTTLTSADQRCRGWQCVRCGDSGLSDHTRCDLKGRQGDIPAQKDLN
jgi:hypothetical protein